MSPSTRWTLNLALVLAFAVSAVAQEADLTGLLINGDFELAEDEVGDKASHWTSDAGSIKVSDQNPYHGERCAVIEHPREDVSTWVSHETVPLEPDQLYVFSVSYRNPTGARLVCQLTYYQNQEGKAARLQRWGRAFRGLRIAGDDQWHRVQRILKVYPGTNFIRVSFAVRGEPCEAYVDDFHLAPLKAARPGEITNLALLGEARSWDPNSGQIVLQKPPHPPTSSYYAWWDGLYAPSSVNDGDDRTYWVSTAPSSDPPKDIGIQWPEPVRVSTVIVKYPHRDVCPDVRDVRLEHWSDGAWREVALTGLALDADLDRGVYLYEVFPQEVTRLRLYFSSFARERVSVQELEVYAEPLEVAAAEVVKNFEYAYPTSPGPSAEQRPYLLMWYQPKRGRSSAEPWLREYSTGLDQDGNAVPVERTRQHLRRRLQMERDAGVDGIMLNLGFNPLSAEIVRQQMEQDYSDTGISGVEHLKLARELGMVRSMPMLYLVAIRNDTWARVGDAAKTLELDSGRKWIDWRDDASWGVVLETVRELAHAAAEAGCPGVALDIEAYIVGMDVYIAENYQGVDAAELLEVVEGRGREMAEAINAQIPDAEIIWLVGYKSDDYTLHNALFRGLTSVGGGGLQIATEGVYTTPDPERIKSLYDDTWQFGLAHAGDQDYWRGKCGVAHGSWPSWPGAGRCLTPDQVRIQLSAFADQEPGPKYMWWYTGSSLPCEDPEWAGYRAAYAGH